MDWKIMGECNPKHNKQMLWQCLIYTKRKDYYLANQLNSKIENSLLNGNYENEVYFEDIVEEKIIVKILPMKI